MKTLLNVENLKVHFPIQKGFLSKTVGYVYAVDDVSFTLHEGETLGLVGESGCGKTTTGLAVLRLTRSTGGRVFYKGKDVLHARKSEMKAIKRQMQIIFQDPYSSLNPRMTVNEIISDPIKIHHLYPKNELRDRIDFLLERVGLSPDQGRRYPHEFSGGQRQRIGIARALALNPSLIIGDEPVSALDVSIQAQIINLLVNLQDEFKLSYIIIAHDLAVVEHICDRIAVMYLGKIVEMSDYKDLYNDPKHPYTQALLSAIPVSEPRAKKNNRLILNGDVPNPINPPPGCHFHPRCHRKMDICTHQRPQLKAVGNSGYAACFLHE